MGKSSIEIHNDNIIRLKTDAVVNAANSSLRQGGGVCGAIFRAAGAEKLQAACNRIGHCPTGSAVITPAFDMKDNKYIIHAVGPIYEGGNSGEKALAGCYRAALDLAKANGCRSIGFPLISAGIYGYPIKEAWRIALTTCKKFLDENPDYELNIVFVNRDEDTIALGRTELERIRNAEI